MTKSILLTGGLLFWGATMAFGQNVGINHTGVKADASAMLDVSSPNKGLLIPWVDLTDKNDKVTIANPAATLLVYNIASNGSEFPQGPGYYYNANEKNDGNAVWVKLLDSQFTTPWLLGGNNDIDAAIHFVGSANDADVVFKRGEVEGVRLTRGGAMLAIGSAVGGITPTQGAGQRLMWIPAKAAFRAGEVSNADWDDANVGLRSFAGGYNTSASGGISTAMGSETSASGGISTAMGFNTRASGAFSTAMGSSTAASGGNSTAMGFETVAFGTSSTVMGSGTFAFGDVSTAMGLGAVASGTSSTAMGANTKASGDYSTAMGYGTSALGNTSTAMGFETTASGDISTAMGYNTTASDAFTTAMGFETTATGGASTAMGYNTTASGITSTAMGRQTTASGSTSTAMGSGTTAFGKESTAMGFQTIAEAAYSLAIGGYNAKQNFPPDAPPSPTDKVFQIGNGTADFLRSDAFFVLRNGNAELAGMLKQGSDIRFKKDILPLEKVMGKIAHIQPITYNFINTQTHPGEHQIGFSAQEVQKQFPELVSENEQGYLSVSYTNMSAVAIQAIKEQQQQIQEQQQQIQSLTVEKEQQAKLNKDQQEQIQSLLHRLEKLEAAGQK
ncbi:MAG: tail fiber domain-containing protein [Chitinophagaceae bacterium]|nr:tail fiber domain-containing protein [Chitinophagaceae bacterium]